MTEQQKEFTCLNGQIDDTGWFFTFGCGHCLNNGERLENRFFVSRQADYGAARREMVAIRGASWAFQYPLSELPGQVEDYGLVEITEKELNP